MIAPRWDTASRYPQIVVPCTRRFRDNACASSLLIRQRGRQWSRARCRLQRGGAPIASKSSQPFLGPPPSIIEALSLVSTTVIGSLRDEVRESSDRSGRRRPQSCLKLDLLGRKPVRSGRATAAAWPHDRDRPVSGGGLGRLPFLGSTSRRSREQASESSSASGIGFLSRRRERIGR